MVALKTPPVVPSQPIPPAFSNLPSHPIPLKAVSTSPHIRLPRAACVLSACFVSTHAATHHLDANTGNDTADGLTPATAWQTLAKTNSVVYQPGDSLWLKSGAVWTGRLQPQDSGTLAARISIDRYGEGPKPVIHGGGIAGGAVTLENREYWTIRKMEG